MPGTGYKCSFEFNLENVTSPGTHLPNRDLLYVAIEVFGQAKRTRLLDAVFPLCVHERFRFERCYWAARDAREVADLLAQASVVIELRQVTDVYLGGCLLAYHETDARTFFQPTLAEGFYRSGERLVTLNRTVDFPGPSPRLEFDSSVAIEALPGSGGVGGVGTGGGSDLLDGDGNSRRARSRLSRKPGGGGGGGGHERQTVAAVLRRTKTPPAASATASSPNGRPPFVVRHVDDSLVSRKPALHDAFALEASGRPPPRRSRSAIGLDGDGDGGVGEKPGGRRRGNRSPSPTARRSSTSLARRYPSLTSLTESRTPLPPPPPCRSPYYPYYYYDPYYYPYYNYYYYPYYRRYCRYPYDRYYGGCLDDLDLLEMDLRAARLRRLYP